MTAVMATDSGPYAVLPALGRGWVGFLVVRGGVGCVSPGVGSPRVRRGRLVGAVVGVGGGWSW